MTKFDYHDIKSKLIDYIEHQFFDDDIMYDTSVANWNLMINNNYKKIMLNHICMCDDMTINELKKHVISKIKYFKNDDIFNDEITLIELKNGYKNFMNEFYQYLNKK